MYVGQDTLKTRTSLKVLGQEYYYFSLAAAESQHFPGLSRLPYSLKILVENLLRFEDGKTVTTNDLHALAQWLIQRTSRHEIAFRPARVLMQDFTGVPAVVDLAAMRDAIVTLGGNPDAISPQAVAGF